ncbi:MAG: hypothetical protein Crog4KO_07550 [Crocinitomicaceae bacterium]
MKNWKYLELIETLTEVYEDFLIQNVEKDQAISRLLDDFYFYPENEHKIENLITTIQTIKLRATALGYVYKAELDSLKKQIDDVPESLYQNELEQNEIEKFNFELKQLESLLINIPGKKS